jgi:hypothetical protein
VFEDNNGNGVRDLHEPGIPGVPLRVSAANATNWIKAVSTDADGFFRVAPLPDTLDFFVKEFDLPGFGSTTPNVVLLRLAALPSGCPANILFGDLRIRLNPRWVPLVLTES